MVFSIHGTAHYFMTTSTLEGLLKIIVGCPMYNKKFSLKLSSAVCFAKARWASSGNKTLVRHIFQLVPSVQAWYLSDPVIQFSDTWSVGMDMM